MAHPKAAERRLLTSVEPRGAPSERSPRLKVLSAPERGFEGNARGRRPEIFWSMDGEAAALAKGRGEEASGSGLLDG